MGSERELRRDVEEQFSSTTEDNLAGKTTPSQELEEGETRSPSKVENATDIALLRRLRSAGKGGSPAAVAAIKKLLASGMTVAQIEARVTGSPERDEETTLRTLQERSPALYQAYVSAGAKPLPAKAPVPQQTPDEKSDGLDKVPANILAKMPTALREDAQREEPLSRKTSDTFALTPWSKKFDNGIEISLEGAVINGASKAKRETYLEGPSLTAEQKIAIKNWKPGGEVKTNLNLLKAGVVAEWNGVPIAFNGEIKLESSSKGFAGYIPTGDYALKVAGYGTVPIMVAGTEMMFRVKLEVALPASLLIDATDLPKLQDGLDKLDDLTKTVDKLGGVVDEADDALEAADDAAKKVGKKVTKKSGERVRNKVAKELADLAKKRGAVEKVLKTLNPLAKKMFEKVLKKQLTKQVAKIAIKALGFALKWVPVIGWVMLAWDLANAAYFAWRWWRGDLRFDPGGGGEAPSIFDGFQDMPKGNGDKPGDAQQGDQQKPADQQGDKQGNGDGDKDQTESEQSTKGNQQESLPKEVRERIEKAAGAKARLFRAVLQKLATGALEPEHLIRLLDITDRAGITDADVDKIIARIGPEILPPDQALDALQKALDKLAAERAKNGDGNGNGDTKNDGETGDGDGGSKEKKGSGDGTSDKKQKSGAGGSGDQDGDNKPGVWEVGPAKTGTIKKTGGSTIVARPKQGYAIVFAFGARVIIYGTLKAEGNGIYLFTPAKSEVGVREVYRVVNKGKPNEERILEGKIQIESRPLRIKTK